MTKLLIRQVVGTFLAAAATLGQGQGFVNLNFESPSPPLVPDAFGTVAITNAMPGWNAYLSSLFGTQQVERVVYNSVSIGSAAISLQGPGSLEPILQGSYTAGLQGSTAGTPTSASLWQIGQVPTNAQSLRFYGAQFVGILVTFNGQPISYGAIGSGPNYTIYGGDISGFAGQTGQLLFAAPPNTGGLLDNIQFSNQPIPEPSCAAIAAFSASLWWVRRRRQRTP